MEPKKIIDKIKSEKRELENVSARMHKETANILREAAKEMGVGVGTILRVIADEFAEQWQKSQKFTNNSQG